VHVVTRAAYRSQGGQKGPCPPNTKDFMFSSWVSASDHRGVDKGAVITVGAPPHIVANLFP